MSFVLEGVMTAVVTPFRHDQSLDLDTLGDVVRYQLASGINTVVVTAGAGEYVSLSPAERAEMVRAVAAVVRGKDGRVISGILAADTRSAVAAAIAAKDAGAQALLLLTPYYIAPSIEGLVDHFRAVADTTGLPIILYNNPARTGINLEMPALERMATIPQVVGVKECDRDLGRVAKKIDALGSRLAFLSGDDDLVLPILSIGARGAIMASTNVIAPWAVALFEATRRGDWTGARDLYLTRILRFVSLYRGPDHPGPLKQLMGLAGLAVGSARPPLRPMVEERLRDSARELDALGLLGRLPGAVSHVAQAAGIDRKVRG